MENQNRPLFEEEKSENKYRLKRESAKSKMELILFLILGFLIGIVIKTESVKKLTIGFEDYKAPTLVQGYDIEQIQKELIKENQSETQGEVPEGGGESTEQE
jgi:hypothetical protein